MADEGVKESERINHNLDNWLAEFKKPEAKRSKWHENYDFPTDELRDQYISTIGGRSEAEIRMLLESFLIQSGVMHSDYYQLAAIKALNQPPGPRESQHNKRLRRVLAGETHVLPWEGVTWVLDLLWVEPREAITVLNAYLITHILELPDGRIHGISDSIEIIRAYYLGLPDSPEEALKLLLSLSSRDMEHLVDDLFHESGYKTELTPARKDGGRDIVARKKESGHQIRIYIEVKNWSRPVGVKEVRALNGVIESESIEKGILVGTSGFTKGEKSAIEFASNVPRIDLTGGKELIELLSQTYGREWPKSIDTYIRHSKQRLIKAS